MSKPIQQLVNDPSVKAQLDAMRPGAAAKKVLPKIAYVPGKPTWESIGKQVGVSAGSAQRSYTKSNGENSNKKLVDQVVKQVGEPPRRIRSIERTVRVSVLIDRIRNYLFQLEKELTRSGECTKTEYHIALHAFAGAFQVNAIDVHGRDRSQAVCDARFGLVHYLITERGFHVTALSRIVRGGCDHRAICWSMEGAKELLATNAMFRERYSVAHANANKLIEENEIRGLSSLQDNVGNGA